MSPQPPPSSLLVGAYRACEGLPVVGGLFLRGRTEAQAVLSLIVGAVIDELDLATIVRERLDGETIDAVVARIDLVALANQVIDGVDLLGMIRESAVAAVAEVLAGMRIQGYGDDAVSGFVDRIRNRRQGFRDRPR